MYDNEEAFDDYAYLNRKKRFNSSSFFKSGKNISIIVIIVLLIVFLIIGLFIYNITTLYHNSYRYIEDNLVKEAKKYITANEINTSEEIFIEAEKLFVSLKDDCSKSVSGVFVKDNNYRAYLLCNEFESDFIDNTSKYIRLNGRKVTFLNKNMEYVESSYEKFSDVNVNIEGHVGLEEGVYELNYIVLQNNEIVDNLIRKIVVLDKEEINDFYPSISLKGDKIVELKVNGVYSDAGVIASDKDDGLIDDIKIVGNVDTSKDGEYNLTYVAVNSKGYASAVSRKVIVLKEKGQVSVSIIQSPLALTNQDVLINAMVFGDNYAYAILPNGEKVTDKDFDFIITENGDYKIDIYDLDGNNIPKNFTIQNIDKELPTGVCSIIINGSHTTVSVNANDNQGISGYSYYYRGNETSYSFSNTYTINYRERDVRVSIKDVASNITTISCNVIKESDDMTITPIPSVSFKCNTDVTNYNRVLAERVNTAGIKTRDAVVAAANYLASELGYKIEYWWAGKYPYIGLNSSWGCNKMIWAHDGSGKWAYGNVHPYGMDCTGFVKWAFVNAYFPEDLIPRYDFKNSNFGNAKVSFADFASNSNLIYSLKRGDILYSPGHAALVVGVDNAQIKLAQLTPAGLKVDLIDKFTGKAITNTADFTGYIILEEFYQMYGN